jgi:hypothetical protein
MSFSIPHEENTIIRSLHFISHLSFHIYYCISLVVCFTFLRRIKQGFIIQREGLNSSNKKGMITHVETLGQKISTNMQKYQNGIVFNG